jgi:hypothetical protein
MPFVTCKLRHFWQRNVDGECEHAGDGERRRPWSSPSTNSPLITLIDFGVAAWQICSSTLNEPRIVRRNAPSITIKTRKSVTEFRSISRLRSVVNSSTVGIRLARFHLLHTGLRRVFASSLELPRFSHRAIASARTTAMSFTTTGKTAPPQAFISSYAPRLRSYGNSLLSPIVPPSNTLPPPRTTKRGTAIISYAEDGYDDDFEDSDGPRRATGLRSIRRDDPNMDKSAQIAALGKELVAPVDIQGIWRDWMGRPKRTL